MTTKHPFTPPNPSPQAVALTLYADNWGVITDTGRVTQERNSEQRFTLGQSPGISLVRRFLVTSSLTLRPVTEQEVPRKAQIHLTVTNTKASGLGMPLPHGRVTVYTPNRQGTLAIAGEPMIADTPIGQELVLELGEAFDVTAKRIQTTYEVTHEGTELGYRIHLRNLQEQAVTVEVVEQVPGDWKLLSSSHGWQRPSRSQLVFRPEVPAGGDVVLTYQVLVRREPAPQSTRPSP